MVLSKAANILFEMGSINRDPNMTQNGHVGGICCRSEVTVDAISGRKVNTLEGFMVVHFEVAGCSSSEIFSKIIS